MRCSSFFDVRFEDVDAFFVYQTAMCFVAGLEVVAQRFEGLSGTLFRFLWGA